MTIPIAVIGVADGAEHLQLEARYQLPCSYSIVCILLASYVLIIMAVASISWEVV